ncbi:PKD domain-containing protein [Pedobacter sp. HMF7647]|uniref:PKD domain-containing protein n=1 Tax=Hufsiella arboris TaxID=2695275 RepID=A0A7K1YEH2_9SPHI|nr:PKD domain-containing protein [Hufsiella arboris]MXV53003.1 PKD domain-containing protein [Hufsiella arboris]
MKYTTASDNPKTIYFIIDYNGSLTVNSVEWNYGDGTKETINGTTASHTYQQAGTYTSQAKVNLKNGKSTCSVEPKKSITVN